MAMSIIKSILLHLDGSERCAERTRVAAAMAETFNATVTGVYSVTPSMLRYPMSLGGPAGALGLQRFDEECRATATRRFADAAAASGRMRSEVVSADAIGDFERRALYADLLILGQRDEAVASAMETPADFVFRQVVGSGRPVLLVPFAGSFQTVGQRVLIAWKETREAARAVSAALPWLTTAASVHAVCYGERAAESLQQLKQYLATHRVNVKVHASDEPEGDIGNALVSRTNDFSADMLVMGCYGHARVREWVLGGASRTVLRTMTVPVLMAH